MDGPPAHTIGVYILIEACTDVCYLTVHGPCEVVVQVSLLGQTETTHRRPACGFVKVNEEFYFQAHFESDWSRESITQFLEEEKATFEILQVFTLEGETKERVVSLGQWDTSIFELLRWPVPESGGTTSYTSDIQLLATQELPPGKVTYRLSSHYHYVEDQRKTNKQPSVKEGARAVLSVSMPNANATEPSPVKEPAPHTTLPKDNVPQAAAVEDHQKEVEADKENVTKPQPKANKDSKATKAKSGVKAKRNVIKKVETTKRTTVPRSPNLQTKSRLGRREKPKDDLPKKAVKKAGEVRVRKPRVMPVRKSSVPARDGGQVSFVEKVKVSRASGSQQASTPSRVNKGSLTASSLKSISSNSEGINANRRGSIASASSNDTSASRASRVSSPAALQQRTEELENVREKIESLLSEFGSAAPTAKKGKQRTLEDDGLEDWMFGANEPWFPKKTTSVATVKAAKDDDSPIEIAPGTEEHIERMEKAQKKGLTEGLWNKSVHLRSTYVQPPDFPLAREKRRENIDILLNMVKEEQWRSSYDMVNKLRARRHREDPAVGEQPFATYTDYLWNRKDSHYSYNKKI